MTQTVNLIIKNLLAESYVTVTEVPENKRNKIVQMTEAGRAYCEKVVRHITWAEDTAMSMFTAEESMDTLMELSKLVGKQRIAWRYDPVLLTEKYRIARHMETFGRTAKPPMKRFVKCFFELLTKTFISAAAEPP